MDIGRAYPSTGEAPYERAPVIAGSMQRPDQWHTQHRVLINGVPYMLTGEQCAEILQEKVIEAEDDGVAMAKERQYQILHATLLGPILGGILSNPSSDVENYRALEIANDLAESVLGGYDL